MSLDTALGTALGAAISLILFGISYRQTIGARRERIRAANAEMERTLVKRFVLDGLGSSPRELERYIDGKAREHRVQPSALLNSSDLLANAYARIFDDDLLESPTRNEALNRVSSMSDKIDQEPPSESWPPNAREELSLQRRSRVLLAFMAATTAMVGSLGALLSDQSDGATYAGALAASLAAIGAAVAVVRLREGDDPEPSRESSLQAAARLERTVERIARKFGANRLDGPDRGLDFLIERDGARIGIELKTWGRPVPRPVMGRIVKSAYEAGRRAGVDEVFMVTSNPDRASIDGLGDGYVHLIGVDDLADALKQRFG